MSRLYVLEGNVYSDSDDDEACCQICSLPVTEKYKITCQQAKHCTGNFHKQCIEDTPLEANPWTCKTCLPKQDIRTPRKLSNRQLQRLREADAQIYAASDGSVQAAQSGKATSSWGLAIRYKDIPIFSTGGAIQIRQSEESSLRAELQGLTELYHILPQDIQPRIAVDNETAIQIHDKLFNPYTKELYPTVRGVYTYTQAVVQLHKAIQTRTRRFHLTHTHSHREKEHTNNKDLQERRQVLATADTEAENSHSDHATQVQAEPFALWHNDHLIEKQATKILKAIAKENHGLKLKTHKREGALLKESAPGKTYTTTHWTDAQKKFAARLVTNRLPLNETRHLRGDKDEDGNPILPLCPICSTQQNPVVEDRAHFTWECKVAQEGLPGLTNAISNLLSSKKDLFTQQEYKEAAENVIAHHTYMHHYDRIKTSDKRPDLVYWQDDTIHVMWAQSLQQQGYHPEEWQDFDPLDTIHPVYLQYILTTLGIKAHIGGVSNHPLLTTTCGDWGDKEAILTDFAHEDILIDITSHDGQDMIPTKHDPTRRNKGSLFWLVTEEQWTKVKHNTHRPILKMAKGTIQMIPGKHWLGENTKFPQNATTFLLVAPRHKIGTLPPLDLANALFPCNDAPRLLHEYLLTKSKAAEATMAGVITPDLLEFIHKLDIYHTTKAALPAKLAHTLIKHQHKCWQARNDLVPHARPPRRPDQSTHRHTEPPQPAHPEPDLTPCKHGQAVACHCDRTQSNPEVPKVPTHKSKRTRPRTLNEKHHAFHTNRHEELHRRNMWDPNSSVTFDTPVPPLPYKVQDLPTTQKRKAPRPKNKPKMTPEEKTKARTMFFTKRIKVPTKRNSSANTTCKRIQTPAVGHRTGAHDDDGEQEKVDHHHQQQQQQQQDGSLLQGCSQPLTAPPTYCCLCCHLEWR